MSAQTFVLCLWYLRMVCKKTLGGMSEAAEA